MSVWDGDNLLFFRNIYNLEEIKSQSGTHQYLNLYNLSISNPVWCIMPEYANQYTTLVDVLNFDNFTYSTKYCALGSILYYNLNENAVTVHFDFSKNVTTASDTIEFNTEAAKQLQVPAKTATKITFIIDTENLIMYYFKDNNLTE